MRPFLKWAGNKHQILEHIKSVLPAGKRLIEPFVGSGAVFLNTDYPSYLLSDINEDLINLYKILQKEGPDFIEYCREFFTLDNNHEKTYYAYRDAFNKTDDLRLRSALFLYMNKYGYNGLCRYNARGEINVPFGRYDRPYFPEKEMLYFHEKAQNAVFECADFRKVMKKAIRGDVVYCDPPYVPLSGTANFTNYSAGGFDMDKQKELALMAEKLSRKKIPVLISNHKTDDVTKFYESAKIIDLKVRRTISCNGAKREKVNEVLALFTS
jgi:DNA adenine methylase